MSESRWSEVEPGEKRVYRVRQYVAKHLKAALRLLPRGYQALAPSFWRKASAVYAWRDPIGRLNVVCVSRQGTPVLISFWPEELREVTRLGVCELGEFRPDPSLSMVDLAKLSERRLVPPSWLPAVLVARRQAKAAA